MSNNSKTSASLQILMDRAEARAERRSKPTLFGEAGKLKANMAKRRLIQGAKGSYDVGPGAKEGRAKLLNKVFRGLIPLNSFEADTIEDAARAAGWVCAAKENQAAHAALRLLHGMYPNPNKRAYHVSNYGPMDWVLKKWASPLSVTVNAARAALWLLKNVPFTVSRFTPKALDLLGRLKPQTRWAAIDGLVRFSVVRQRDLERSDYRTISHRELNWAAVAIAQKGLRAASAYWPSEMREKYEWGYVLGVKPVDAAVVNKLRANSVSPSLFKEILDFSDSTSRVSEMVDASFRLALMFHSLEAVKQWVIKTEGEISLTTQEGIDKGYDSSAVNRVIRVHDAAQLIPMCKIHTGWAPLLLRAPAQMKPVLRCIPQIQEHLDGKAPKTVAEALTLMEELGLENFMYNLTSQEVSFIQSTPVKSWEELPNVILTQGKYTLKKVPYNSPLNLIAGRLVNCCQHLAGAGASCAAQAYSQPQAGIYAVYMPDGTMVAQTFAWRSKKGSALVFDSIEALRGHDVVGLFYDAAHLIVGQFGIRRVLSGCSSYGITRQLVNLCEDNLVTVPECAFSLRYTDVNGVCAVVARSERDKVELVETQKVETISPVINELQPGSGVYCEHCGAEVHPATEICPSCGVDISEWVD